MNRTNRAVEWVAAMVVSASFALTAQAFPTAQGSALTYQGVLKNSGTPMNASVDLQFKLFDAAVAGTPIGSTLALNAVIVTNGLFSASLDFGSLAFNGEERWLEIAVASPASGGAGPFTTLTPRQKLASAPYAAYALQSALSGTYANALNLSNPSNTITGTFTGSGSALTNLNPANLGAGTAGISITGNAANVSGIVAIANGGTGANNATTARTNLGAAATSHTHAAADIASGNLDPLRLPTGGNWALSSSLTFDTDMLFLNPTSNLIGIGTTSPGAPLDVLRTASTNVINPLAIFRSGGTGNSSGAIRTQNSAGNHFNFGITQGGDFALNYNLNISQASDLLRFTPTGSLGLGVLAPTAKLHVNGDVRIDSPGTGHGQTIEAFNAFGDASILLRSPSSGGQFIEFRDAGDANYSAIIGLDDGDDNLTLAVDGGPRLSITPTGRVGINTVAPTEMLHVNGNARIDGSITIPFTDRIASYSPFAFQPGASSTTYTRNSFSLNGSTAGAIVIFGAPVKLPQGAIITSVDLIAKDDDAGNISLTLNRINLTNGVGSTILTINSSGDEPGARTFSSVISPISGTLYNDLFGYSMLLQWSTPATVTDILIHGVRVNYKVDQPLP